MEELFDDQHIESDAVDLSRYFRAIIKRWWLILLVTVGIVIPWIIYVKQQPPIYEAEATISFESITVQENQIQSRIRKLKSRTFAEEVTAELGLTLNILQDKEKPETPLRRQDVFTHFSTTKQPTLGTYSLRFYPTGACAFYFESERLDSVQVEQFIEDTVTYKELTFCLNSLIAGESREIVFAIGKFRAAVENLMAKERINTSRRGDLISIALRDKNPLLASQMVNSLTQLFIVKSNEIRQDQNRNVTSLLKDKLDQASERLAQTEAQLRTFHNQYITGLDTETRETVNQLAEVDADTLRAGVYINELAMLLKKLNPVSDDFDVNVSQRYIYSQITQQPAFEGDANMNIVRQEYNDLDSELQSYLERRTPPSNRLVVELYDKIRGLEDKIIQLTNDKIQELKDRRIQSVRNMQRLRGRLGEMPSEQLRYMTLERKRRTNEEIYTDYLKRYNEAKLSEAVVSENVSILDPAVTPEVPVSGNKRKRVLIGALLAFIFGICLVVVLEMADKRIKTQKDVRRYIHLPFLGVIPKVKFDDYEIQDSEKAKSISSQIVTHDYSPTPVGEAYRALRTSLLFSKSVGPIRSLAIGSVSPGEGKSFTATNLAITLAQQKSKTLLIDGDLRRGVLHNTFNCPKKPGLTNYLTGVVPLESVLNETYIPNLTLITCGALIPNPSELLGSVRMKRFIEGITKRFDFVLFDTPPLMAATDAVILGTLVDGIAVLVRSGMTNREDVKRKLELFQNVHANVVGVVLNCAGVEIAHEGYSYYRY